MSKKIDDRRNFKVKNRNGKGKAKVKFVTGDPDWSINEDWESSSWDLSPKNK